MARKANSEMSETTKAHVFRLQGAFSVFPFSGSVHLRRFTDATTIDDVLEAVTDNVERLSTIIKDATGADRRELIRLQKLEYDVAAMRRVLLPPVEVADYDTAAPPRLSLAEIQQVVEFLRLGLFVNAIKYVRDATGVGLKEAKDFCDKLRP